MDERIRERRRQVGQSRGRRRLAVAVAALLIVLAGVGFLWVRSSSVFAVRYASVPVAEHVSPEALRAALLPVSGVNLLRVSTEELEQTLVDIPWVRSARVYRRFPDSLEVSVDEHTAAAVVRDSEGVDWLLAEDGTVLEQTSPSSPAVPRIVLGGQGEGEGEVYARLGITVGPRLLEGIPVALALEAEAGAWPSAEHPVDHIVVLQTGDFVLELQRGGQVRLGDDTDLDEKFMVAREIVDRYLKDGKSLEYVDVRVPSRPVAKAR
jgi:cell division protein FtsQ